MNRLVLESNWSGNLIKGSKRVFEPNSEIILVTLSLRAVLTELDTPLYLTSLSNKVKIRKQPWSVDFLVAEKVNFLRDRLSNSL